MNTDEITGFEISEGSKRLLTSTRKKNGKNGKVSWIPLEKKHVWNLARKDDVFAKEGLLKSLKD